MENLKIKWKRLVTNGKTCERCGKTEKELKKAISVLKRTLKPLGIEVVLEKEVVSFEEFKKNPLLSNQIYINDIPLEEWINGNVGQSLCCDVCESYECRTLEIDGKIYETINNELIIKAGVIAVSQLFKEKTNKTCCSKQICEKSSNCCSN